MGTELVKSDTKDLCRRLLTFCEEITQRKCYKYQEEFLLRVIESIIIGDAEEICGLFSRQSGKTESIGIVVAGLMVILPKLSGVIPQLAKFKEGVWVGIFAPVFEQGSTTYDRVQKFLKSEHADLILSDPEIDEKTWEKKGREIGLKNKSICRIQSASRQSKIESKTYHIIIVEECVGENSRVALGNGRTKEIKDIKVGDKVLGFKDNKIVEDTVVNVWNRGIRQVYEVKDERGNVLLATGNHKIYTNEGWRTVEELRKGPIDKPFILLYNTPIQESICMGGSYDGQTPVNTRHIAWGRKLWMWGQKVLQMSKIGYFTLTQAVRICEVQVQCIKRLVFNRTKDSSKWRQRRLFSKISNKVFDRIGEVLRTMLSKWEESSNLGMVGTVDSRSIGSMVYGRRMLYEKWFDTDFDRRVQFDGNRVIENNVTRKIWDSSQDKGRQKNSQKSYSISGNGTKQVCTFNNALCNTKYVLQTVRLRVKENMCGMWERIYNTKTTCRMLLQTLLSEVAKSKRRVQSKGKTLEKYSREQTEGYITQQRVEEETQKRGSKLVSVIQKKTAKVYDIETAISHTFFANQILVHNCQDVDDIKITKSIHPMGASTAATIIKIGSVGIHKGEFFRAIQRCKRSGFKKGSRKNHFEYNYKVCQKYNDNYRKFIEKEKKRLGEHSDAFRMSYGLEWLLERGMFCSQDLLDSCLDSKLEIVTDKRDNMQVAGIDFGKQLDSTVITVLDLNDKKVTEDGDMEKTVLNWLELEGDNYEDQYPKYLEFFARYNITVLAADATGVGAPIVDRLEKDLPDIMVVPVVMNITGKNDIYLYFQQELNTGRFKIPGSRDAERTIKHKKFCQQMTDLEKIHKGKYLSPSAPKEKDAHDDYCLSEDTEILTDSGFKGINELTEQDGIGAWDNGKIVYQTTSRIIRKQYSGKMLHFNGEHFECLVTPEHKMVFERKTSNGKISRWEKDTRVAKDLLLLKGGCINRRFPVAGKIGTRELWDVTDAEIKLMGWMITEGWICKSKRYNDARYQLGQSNKVYPKKVEEIEAILKELKLDYNTYNRKDGLRMWQFRKVSKKIFDRLLKDGVHRIPRWFLSYASYRQMQVLFNTMMDGDGTWSRMTYNTTSFELAQDFQELCHKINRGAFISDPGKDRYCSFTGKTYQRCYSVYVQKEGFKYVQDLREIDYSGKVWCVTVPAGFIVIRYNGKIGVVGNCDSSCLACWASKQEGMPEIEAGEADSLFETEI